MSLRRHRQPENEVGFSPKEAKRGNAGVRRCRLQGEKRRP
jgi:hypothetical protein